MSKPSQSHIQQSGLGVSGTGDVTLSEVREQGLFSDLNATEVQNMLDSVETFCEIVLSVVSRKEKMKQKAEMCPNGTN